MEAMDSAHAEMCAGQLRLFTAIARADSAKLWEECGAFDMAHWLSMRYGISSWHARRWIAAAHAMERLSELPRAFASGELGLEKTLELSRFATPENEHELVDWARHASKTAVRS